MSKRRRPAPPVNKAYRRRSNTPVIHVQGRVVPLAKADTAKAVLAVAKDMSEEATVYDLFNKTKEMGLHSDELWEWGLSEPTKETASGTLREREDGCSR